MTVSFQSLRSAFGVCLLYLVLLGTEGWASWWEPGTSRHGDRGPPWLGLLRGRGGGFSFAINVPQPVLGSVSGEDGERLPGHLLSRSRSTPCWFCPWAWRLVRLSWGQERDAPTWAAFYCQAGGGKRTPGHLLLSGVGRS